MQPRLRSSHDLPVRTLSLAEELLLIAHAGGSRASDASSIALDCGLAGALLYELVLAGRIGLVDGYVTVVDREPTGDAIVDAALSRITHRGADRKPSWWIASLRTGARRRLLEELVQRGLLEARPQNVLRVFSTTHHTPTDLAAESIRTRLTRVVTYGEDCDERAVALATIVHAAGLTRRATPDLDPTELHVRLTQFAAAEWIGVAVRNATRSIRISVMIEPSSRAAG